MSFIATPSSSSLFGSTTVFGQSLPVPLLVGLAFSDFIDSPHSRIVSPTYGGTVHSGLEAMTGMLLSRSS